MQLGRNSVFLGTDHGNSIAGKFTSIAGGVYIHGNYEHACIKKPDLVSCFDFGLYGAKFCQSGMSGSSSDRVIIGNDVWIGICVNILSGVTIGDGAVIGAHSVIAKDVPPYTVVVGNPAVIKKYRFDEQTIIELLDIKWWDWDEETIKSRLEDFKDIKSFVKKYGWAVLHK